MAGHKGAHYYHYKNKAEEAWLDHHSFHTMQEHPVRSETKRQLISLDSKKRNINLTLSSARIAYLIQILSHTKQNSIDMSLRP
jgi:hypothetical protein